MKFIRDIIVERANMTLSDAPAGTEDELNGWETPVAAPKLPDEIEPVHVAAPVGRMHSRMSQSPRFEAGFNAGIEDDDEFDLLDETNDGVEIEGQSSPARAELFADIWGRENVEKVIDDVFSDEPPYPAEPQQRADNPFLADDEAIPDQITADVEDVAADAPAPFDRIETPPTSAISTFQRFRRKQTAESSEANEVIEVEMEMEMPDTPPASKIIAQPIAPVPVPTPAAGRARRPAGRVKTRLLGFGNDHNQDDDLFANGSNTNPAAQAMFPVGWMVIVSGPGCGTAFALQNGVSQIGRGEGQAVRLDYGDTSISRENHAAVAYDAEQQEFFLGHGGKANLVRLNGKPVLSTEALTSGALIRIGETTLRFIGFCGSDFDWGNSHSGEDEHVQLG